MQTLHLSLQYSCLHLIIQSVFFFSLVIGTQQHAWKIMPLGDSITLGVGGGGYRDPLGKSLASLGKGWDYVGPLWSKGNHAGYNGWTIKQISNVVKDAVSIHVPDIVLLMAGTNDFFFSHNDPDDPTLGANATEAVKRMDTLLGDLFSAHSSCHVLLSGVTNINATLCANYPSAPWHPPACPTDMPKNIAMYNNLVQTIVTKYKNQGHSIDYHDPNPECQFIESDYFTWGIHFSPDGYKKMANSWFTHLKPILAQK